MKLKSQIEAWKSVRKPMPPPTKVERPTRGDAYKRPTKNWRNWEDD